ncbi:MAG TPA: hypothetical protein VHV10_02410 [Ktedonobacteraceae bacterium]|jgi:hypothetical protein|nr:hypothetical protein [Ktedonobacteraceae bacterium]
MAYEMLIVSAYPGWCTDCKQWFPANTYIMRDAFNKKNRHKTCYDKWLKRMKEEEGKNE